jgi:dihydroorotase
MSTERFLLRGAQLSDGTTTDLLLADGRIAETGTGLSAPGATVIDADGLLALPGLVDLHTHLREPGYEQSETVLTGSQAAAIGGYTTVFAMANTSPVQDRRRRRAGPGPGGERRLRHRATHRGRHRGPGR